MADVSEYYIKYGIPANLTELEEAEFRAIIEATQVHLDYAPANFPSSAATSFRMTLRMMYIAIGGDPDTLP